jgi:hypothetical protein
VMSGVRRVECESGVRRVECESGVRRVECESGVESGGVRGSGKHTLYRACFLLFSLLLKIKIKIISRKNGIGMEMGWDGDGMGWR